jgi:hypothetical protein
MPRLSAFYGIVIYMYIRDHGPPHIHAWAAEQRAVVDIATGAVSAGELKLGRQRWSETGSTSTAELSEAWMRASRGDSPGTIEPLP